MEVLDSRGNPTVSATVTLENGITAGASVPSGASTGEKEAVELRDGDMARYEGKGVLKAISHIEEKIAPAIRGMNATDQAEIDRTMIELDGTPDKSVLGANAILGVSMAAARAGAAACGLPLYRYLGGARAHVLPVPCLNVINGGRHADNTLDFQEFKIAPHSAANFRESLRMGIETFHALKGLLRERKYSTGIGDEGGFAPDLKTNDEAVEIIIAAIEKAGYRPGDDIAICVDPATSEMWTDGRYEFFKSGGGSISSDELISLWEKWVARYPIALLEDPLGEKDWDGWKKITSVLGGRLEIVGDDIFCTNPAILRQAIQQKVANSILIKLNQIGTVSETLDCISLAQDNNYRCYISHRSGETDDTFIADLAVATGAGHIKTGSGCRGERIAKFNRLLAIEKEIGRGATFGGQTLSWKVRA